MAVATKMKPRKTSKPKKVAQLDEIGYNLFDFKIDVQVLKNDVEWLKWSMALVIGLILFLSGFLWNNLNKLENKIDTNTKAIHSIDKRLEANTKAIQSLAEKIDKFISK